MRYYADAWYSSATLWAAAAVVVAAVAGAAAVWATLRAAGARRTTLFVSMAGAELLNTSTAMGSLEVLVNGNPLANPRIVTLIVANDGKRDITAESYSESNPVRLDVGCPIVEVIGAETRPDGRAVPTYSTAGSELHLGPGLISARQALRFQLLVDGPEPTLSCHAALLAVDIESVTRSPRNRFSLPWELDSRVPDLAAILTPSRVISLAMTVSAISVGLSILAVLLLLDRAGVIQFPSHVDPLPMLPSPFGDNQTE